MLLTDIIPSHTLAQWLLTHIHRLLDMLGLEHDPMTQEIIYVCIIVGIAVFIGWALANVIRMGIRKIVRVRNPQLANDLISEHVLTRSSRVIPPLFVLALIPFAIKGSNLINTILIRGILVYTAIVFCIAVCAVASFIWNRFEAKRNTRNLPLRGILDTIIGILWVITAIVCVAIIVDKSPAVLLGGLGAFAAVLMLVFKDSILGLVAGLQLSQNDMLHVGDWIAVPSAQANGIVIDASLTTIKVQNWDNTIITIPPYNLVSGAFQNWRGMQESGVRQIARSILIDSYSINPVTSEETDTLVQKYPSLAPYVKKLRDAGHLVPDPGLATVNGSLASNMGLFRAYMCQWLLDNPGISNDHQILVRLMAPTENGIPLQIWCFTSTTAWTAYEAIQSDLFEHIAITAPDFGLRIFNETSGADVLTIDTAVHPALTQSETPAPSPTIAPSEPKA